MFPAGYYQFEQILGNSDGVEILVASDSKENPQFYQAVATKAEKMSETQSASKIVFRHSGEKLVLAEVCSHSKHTSLELYDVATLEPIIAKSTQGADDVELQPDGDLLAMATTARQTR